MDSEFSGRWPALREREATAYRVQCAEIAALLARADAVRRRAEALRLLPDPPVLPFDVTAPAATAAAAATATADELARHATHLRDVVTEARQNLERQISEVFASRLQQKLRAREEPQEAQEATLARRALADNLTRCDPADIDDLERLALGLAETGPAGLRELEQRLADSVDRGQQAMQATISRERIKVLIADVLPDEEVMLTALLARTHDGDLPAVMNQVQAAVGRADQHRSQVDAADAVTRALRDLSWDIGPGAAAQLAETGVVTLLLADGHGVRVSVSGSSVRLQAARPGDGRDSEAGGTADAAAALIVRDMLGRARAHLLQTGMQLGGPWPPEST